MKTIKVEKCGDCPFCILQEDWVTEYCEHPYNKGNRLIEDCGKILQTCPLKKEPLKIELKQ